MFKIIALESPPVAKYAPIGLGSVQGALATTLLTKFKLVAIQDINAQTIGVIINGMISIGFKTIVHQISLVH